jgi:hypothetical protein
MSFPLDANSVSESRKRSPYPFRLAWFETVSASALFLNVPVIGEIRQAGIFEGWLQTHG